MSTTPEELARLKAEAIAAELAAYKRAQADMRDAERRLKVARRSLEELGADVARWGSPS